MDSVWFSVTFMCKGSKWMIFHFNGVWGSSLYAPGCLCLHLRLSLSLSLRLILSLRLRGGLWLIPSGICGMEDPPQGMVYQFRLQMAVNRRSCRCTRTRS